METVFLKSISKGEKVEFSLLHANRIFQVQKQNPPKSWKLDDDRYEIVSNEIKAKSAPVVLATPEPVQIIEQTPARKELDEELYGE
jgi:hypothetical protein